IFGETLVGRQVFEAGYFTEMTHPAVAPCVFAKDEFAFPKSDRAMLFECGHSKHDPVIVEMRHAPFYCLLHLRASLVNQLPDMSQNRLCKRCSPCDIGINPRILASHDGRVNFRGARRQPICRTHRGNDGVSLFANLCSTAFIVHSCFAFCLSFGFSSFPLRAAGTSVAPFRTAMSRFMPVIFA